MIAAAQPSDATALAVGIAVGATVLLTLLALLVVVLLRRRRRGRGGKPDPATYQVSETLLAPSPSASHHRLATSPVTDAEVDAVELGEASGYTVPARLGAMDSGSLPTQPVQQASVPGTVATYHLADPDLQPFIIPYMDLNVDMMRPPLGSGSFGIVYLGKWQGTKVAVKQVRSEIVQGRGADEVIAEVKVMMKLNAKHHRNVVHLSGVCLDNPPNVYLVVEHYAKGNLFDALQNPKQRKEYRSIAVRRQIALDIASGMAYLHAEGVLHGDLAARNVLLRQQDNSIIACVADFGLATKLQANSATSSVIDRPLPVRWSAPEVLSDAGKFERASDVWAYGVVLYELHSLGAVKEPYEILKTNREVINFVVVHHGQLPKPRECPPKDYNLMRKCWEYRADQRLSMGEVLRFLELMGNQA